MRIRRNQVRATEELHEEAAAGPGGAGIPARIDLERAFERLSETSRAVVWLHDVEGYTHEEIAEQMGKTVSFSKSQLARAHVRLRRMLDEGVSRGCTARWTTCWPPWPGKGPRGPAGPRGAARAAGRGARRWT